MPTPIPIRASVGKYGQSAGGRAISAKDAVKSMGEFAEKFSALLNKMADSARGFAPTTRIEQNIEVDEPELITSGNETKLVGSIFVSLKKAPEARAYEFGSGIHATKGAVGTYPIVARNADNLVFWWENRQKWFVGSKVNHPGVRKSAYLRPALRQHRKELQEFTKYIAENVAKVLVRKVFIK